MSKVTVKRLERGDIWNFRDQAGVRLRCYACGCYFEVGMTMVTVDSPGLYVKKARYHLECFNREKAQLTPKIS